MYSDEDIAYAKKEYREVQKSKSQNGWTPSIYLYGEQVAFFYGQRLDDHYGETFLVRRFFDVVTGFHRGSLDLAGRHYERYEQHMKIWESFLTDFNQVTAATGMSEPSALNSQQHSQYAINPFSFKEAPFEEFCGIWKLPLETITLPGLREYTRQVLEVIQENPEVRIQVLCLPHLPVEILDRIFELCGIEEGRVLSLTCQNFYKIGVRHIFKERALRFETPPGYYEGINHHNDPANFTIGAAEVARTKVLASAQFLVYRPAIASRVLRLELSDSWAGAPLYFDNPRLVGFYIPLQGAWLSVLGICKNVQVLELRSIILDPRFVDAICELRQLHTLILECLASPTIADKLQQSRKSLPSLRILRMSMKLRTTSADLWSLLILFPLLQSFSVQQTLVEHWSSQQPTTGFLSAPPETLWSKIDLSSLEHLSMSNFHPLMLRHVSRWLQSAPRMVNLKQLRFYSCYGIKDDIMTRFLESLATAPLQMLVVNGIAEGGDALFRVLPGFFPKLRGVMILRRASPRQLMTRESPWPLRPIDYARHLGSLPDLQYFGWNRQDNHYWHVGSLPLARFEQDFLPDAEAPAYDPLEDLWDDHEDDWIARMFAQVCPDLKGYTHECGSLRIIERSEVGRITVKRQGEGGNWMRTLPDFASSNFGYTYWEPVLPDVLV